MTRPARKGWALLLILMFAVFLLGCSLAPTDSAPTDTATPTPSPSPTLTPTATIVWFPPTETPTPFPTPTPRPTPEPPPGINILLAEDDFSTGTGWDLYRVTRGSAAIGANELTLAVLEPGAYLTSIRSQPVIRNFYLEITASISLCADKDEYGLIFRHASQADYYRFSLSCDGYTRLDRIYRGTPSSPQPPLFSSSVPRTPSSTVTLAIWAWGPEMRFYINGVQQFTVTEPTIPEGLVGVFARSRGENAVTVNFSNLTIHQVTVE